MLNEFTQIFTEMSILTVILLVAGFSLMLLEIVFSAFGMFMLVGVVGIIGGVVTRAIQGATIFQIIAMVVIFGVVALILFYTYLKIVENKSAGYVDNAVSTKYENPYEEFGYLLGLIGVSTTECKPYGKAKIDGKRYEVVSDDGSLIPKDVEVEVVDVDYDHIFVRTIN